MSSRDEAEDSECTDACAMLLEAATASSAELRRFQRLDARQQRKLYRETRRLARGYRREGYGPDEVATRIAHHIQGDPEFESIFGILLLAALAATIQFWVKRLWERWFPSEQARSLR